MGSIAPSSKNENPNPRSLLLLLSYADPVKLAHLVYGPHRIRELFQKHAPHLRLLEVHLSQGRHRTQVGRIQDKVHGFRPREFPRASELNDLAPVIYVLLMFESVKVDTRVRQGEGAGLIVLQERTQTPRTGHTSFGTGRGARIRPKRTYRVAWFTSSSTLKHMAVLSK